MDLKNLKYLKELSWYTTVPLFVCAWIMQDMSSVQGELSTIFGFLKLVGEYFIKVVFGLLIAYWVWLEAAVRLEKDSPFFTLLLATYLLTLAAVGFAIFIIKPEQMSLPVNVIWFAALASVAFNLYEIKTSTHNNAPQPTPKSGATEL